MIGEGVGGQTDRVVVVVVDDDDYDGVDSNVESLIISCYAVCQR